MKFLGLERDNTTLLSSPDPLGWEYSASFELYPFHEGKDRSVYKGIMNGRGPKRGNFCVVKAKVDTTAVAADWKHVQEAVRCAITLATSFNVLVNSRVISFVWPKLAEMGTISDFTPLIRLFKPHDKRLKKEEVVLIEDFLEGDFETYNSTVGWVDPNSKADITQAFSHFTWHATRSLVVCGLQGVAEGRGFRLTSPTIHSRDRRYGESDGGLAGVMEFFSSHRCNNICSSWPGPDVPDIKFQRDLNVHKPGRQCNRPRRDCNVYIPPHEPHVQYVPKVPSAPMFDSTRF